MKFVVSSLTHLYTKLIQLYPVPFRTEFAEEMQTVFRDTLNDATRDGIRAVIIVWLRELAALPFSVLREFWHEIERKRTMMLPENVPDTPEDFSTTGQVIIGSLPFFLFGLIMILFELPNLDTLITLGWFDSLVSTLFGMLLILPALGFGVGWIRNFPRWSYPYGGMAFALALYIRSASTPGLNFFGVPIFGRELWGWRAWIPLGVAFVIALMVSRSFKPFVKLFSNLWKDWSILSYLMAGFLPLLVIGAFDEIDRLYSLYFMVPFAILLVGMVLLYLRSKSARQRVLVLTIGVLAILFPSVLGSNSYWLNHNGMYLSGASRMLMLAGKIALIMLLPAWLELLRGSIRRLRTT